VADLWLFGVDVVVVAALVAVYVRWRHRLAAVAATVSSQPERTDSADAAEVAESDVAVPVRWRGVLRVGRLSAMFVVVEIDAGALRVRSRPGFLGLGLAVPRADVAEVRQPAVGRGKVPCLVFVPVAERAVGLDRLRLQVRGDAGSLTRELRRLGWSESAPGAGRSGRGSDAKPRRGG
jgi:hypothetical protein